MRSFVASFALILVAVSAQAQSPERGAVYGLGGLTFGTETSSVVGGGLRFKVTPTIQVFGEAGRMQNVLPKSLHEDFDTLISGIAAYYGMPFTMDVKVPALYGLGGVRFLVPTKGKVQPFFEAGVGLASLSFNIDAKIAGIDVSSEVEDEADLSSETELMVAFGGGIDVALTKTLGLDAGYRFVRVNTEDPAINTSTLYAGLRFAF